MNGLVYGTSLGSQTRDDRNRYYQELLGYTLVFPDDWTIAETTTTVTATGPENDTLSVEVQRFTSNVEPRVFIRDTLGIPNLQESEALEQFRLLGHTGTVQSVTTGGPQRIAVIYMGPRAFIFTGQVANLDQSDRVDAMLLESIRSFRAIQRNELLPGDEMKIKYVQASEYFDFSIVAQSSRLSTNAEESLRLLNGYWPTGNPEAGDWIKLIE
jgi:predicted Zn-dependent protease